MDGEAFPNPVKVCEECKCVNGVIDCHQTQCARPHCNAPRPGTCCQNNCNGEELSSLYQEYKYILLFIKITQLHNIHLSQAAAMLGGNIPTDRSFPILPTRAGHAAV